RFRSGEVEDLGPIYRVPVGGARLTPETEARYFYGPPLRNPQIGAVRGRGEVFVTTYDRDRKIGALYRILDGRATLLAGGTPPAGTLPLSGRRKGGALDTAGNLYVTDREQNVVVRLDPNGKVLDAEYVAVTRGRTLVLDEQGRLWIGGDGTADTPFQDGVGQILRAGVDRALGVVLEGPLPAGMSLSPGGALFVAQRRTGKSFVVTPDGKRIEFAAASEGTFLRSVAFAPVTPETRRAGIAGDLFVIVIPRQVWAINEVIRISGPFDEFVRRQRGE